MDRTPRFTPRPSHRALPGQCGTIAKAIREGRASPEIGQSTHSGRCVDPEEGTIDCICGLDEGHRLAVEARCVAAGVDYL
ncbi:MAG TPA: hypothetical protein VMW08_00240 [Acidimicrobiales bacterium]|nr:hypothetical protein [Acidimicrobiales bacterium]